MEDSFDEINETNDEINDEIIYPEPEERQLSILENTTQDCYWLVI